ncbi:Fe(II)-2OG oxygenase family protein, partial [Streptomyces violascens]
MSVNTIDTAEKFASGEATVAKLAWTRAEVAADRSWSIPLPAEVIAEFKAYRKDIADPAALIDTIERTDVDLPHLATFSVRLREQVLGRFGFVLVTGLAEGGFSEDEQRLFYVLTSLHLGEMLTPYGRLHEVADRGYDYRSADVSVSKTRVKAPFHTDSTSK